ncbi:MAG: glycine C-acetyltransferase [Planctomycetaceae bacterium]
MAGDRFCKHLAAQVDGIRSAGLYKSERVITSPQEARIGVANGTGRQVLNLCANNYLGLSDHPDIVRAAHEGLDRWGYGMSSVRFICGTQAVHKELEAKLSAFLGTEDTILYSSCFDANGGLFETLLTDEDAVISDELNHASIIDGIRLCKAQRLRYRNNDMDDLRAKLQAAQSARFRLIATDGVFSMDGYFANLPAICELADEYDALVMVDDSHAVGFIGERGRGTPELHGVTDRVDILTGTLGKALGGASGGYTSGRKEIIELLRQRSRPYLFSNSVAPPIVAASLKALELIERETSPAFPSDPSAGASYRDSAADWQRPAKPAQRRAAPEAPGLLQRLRENTAYFRAEMPRLGFDILPGEHPIVPVMIGDAAQATAMADALLDRGVYVIGFSYPVVPQGKARIRCQMSAAHSGEDLEFAIEQFAAVR